MSKSYVIIAADTLVVFYRICKYRRAVRHNPERIYLRELHDAGDEGYGVVNLGTGEPNEFFKPLKLWNAKHMQRAQGKRLLKLIFIE